MRAITDVDEVSAQAIELWSSIADEELERNNSKRICYNGILSCKDELVNLLLSVIDNVKIQQDDEINIFSYYMSSVCCLHKINLLLKSAVMPQIMSFVQQKIVQGDWKCRYSALNALGAILQGTDS